MANEIYIAQQDTLEEVKDIAIDINTNVGTANETLGDFTDDPSNIVNEIYSLKESLALLTSKIDNISGGIKRVQRGKVDEEGASKNITLTYPVNPEKTFVLAYGLGVSGEGTTEYPNGRGDKYYFPCATLENSTTLQVRGGGVAYDGGSQYIQVAWQVIEFN